MDNQSPSMLKAALIGGAAAGVLAGLPYIGKLNLACCSLIVVGGFLAAFIQSRACKKVGAPFAVKSGALVGLLAGLVYAVVATLMTGFPILRADHEELRYSFDEAITRMEEMGMEPEQVSQVAEFLENTSMSAIVAIIVICFFVLWLLSGLVFSTIGGLIGGAACKFEPTPPAPPASESTPSPPDPTQPS
jgi:uncharacterized protein YybS (DUF2232 family)